jgi:hypothetical protein
MDALVGTSVVYAADPIRFYIVPASDLYIFVSIWPNDQANYQFPIDSGIKRYLMFHRFSIYLIILL